MKLSESTLWRYIGFQLPQVLLVGLVLWGFHLFAGLSAWIAAALLAGWIAKEALLYPFVRKSYEPSEHVPGRELIGARGVTIEQLAEGGYVRIGGELWRAENAEPGRALPKGTPVRVRALRGHSLLIESDPA